MATDLDSSVVLLPIQIPGAKMQRKFLSENCEISENRIVFPADVRAYEASFYSEDLYKV